MTDQEQQLRFLVRIHDPLKQWKLSPMDLQSRVRWEDYTKAKEEMLARTNIPEAPWYIVEGNDKRRARLNCISHLLSLIPYEEVPHEEVTLPERVYNATYERAVLPRELYVPENYPKRSGGSIPAEVGSDERTINASSPPPDPAEQAFTVAGLEREPAALPVALLTSSLNRWRGRIRSIWGR
jgi:hypothetical protein